MVEEGLGSSSLGGGTGVETIGGGGGVDFFFGINTDFVNLVDFKMSETDCCCSFNLIVVVEGSSYWMTSNKGL